MAKGKKFYSGKELIRRRQIERQQAEQRQSRLIKTLKQVNQLRPAIEKTKQRMRKDEGNGSVID